MEATKEAAKLARWLLAPLFFLTGCEVPQTETELEPEPWQIRAEYFVETFAGANYNTSWTTRGEGTRCISIKIGEEVVGMADETNTTLTVDALPFHLEIDGQLIEEGFILLDLLPLYRTGRLTVKIPTTRNSKVGLVSIDGMDYFLGHLRFGRNKEGAPSLDSITFQEARPNSRASNLRVVYFTREESKPFR